jgi:hypothetical protein
MLPVMATALARDVRILLDDTHRPAESAILRRWAAEGGFSAEQFSDGAKTYALLTSQLTTVGCAARDSNPEPAD